MAGKVKKSVFVLLLLVLAGIASYWSYLYLASYEIDYGQVENIDGIEFPTDGGDYIVTEKLAHADIYAEGITLGRRLLIKVKFRPDNIDQLSVGIRENYFWLSYDRRSICCEEIADSGEDGLVEREIRIPLTDKIVSSNGSVDLMFFASNSESGPGEDDGVEDTVVWRLEEMVVETEAVLPSWREVKDWVRMKSKI